MEAELQHVSQERRREEGRPSGKVVQLPGPAYFRATNNGGGREVSEDGAGKGEGGRRGTEGGAQMRWLRSGSGEEESAGRGSIPLLFMKDSSWSGISARTSLASRAMLRTWFPDRSM